MNFFIFLPSKISCFKNEKLLSFSVVSWLKTLISQKIFEKAKIVNNCVQKLLKILHSKSASIFFKFDAFSRNELKSFLNDESITFENLMKRSPQSLFHSSFNAKILSGFFFLKLRDYERWTFWTFSCEKNLFQSTIDKIE